MQVKVNSTWLDDDVELSITQLIQEINGCDTCYGDLARLNEAVMRRLGLIGGKIFDVFPDYDVSVVAVGLTKLKARFDVRWNTFSGGIRYETRFADISIIE